VSGDEQTREGTIAAVGAAPLMAGGAGAAVAASPEQECLDAGGA
jgi:hypothetical protein